MSDADFYRSVLYPWQDRVLAVVHSVKTGFYLGGGTAASRGYLQHRYSDDLDFFANDATDFRLWVDRVINKFHKQAWTCQITLFEDRFARLFLSDESQHQLKMEFINDVPSRVGAVIDHELLGRLDSAENILANKVTAILDREEPKDFADIWGFCCQLKLSLKDAIGNAQGKAAGIFQPDLARVLLSVEEADWAAVRWVQVPPKDSFLDEVRQLGEDLVLNP